MSLTPLPDTQRYASLIATMRLAEDSGFPELFGRVPSKDESRALAPLQCLKSLDDLDEEEDGVEGEDEEDLEDEDEEEDEDEDEDLDEDYDEDEDDEDEDEEEEEDEDEDGGVKPLKMISL